MVDLDEYNAVLTYPFPKNSKELIAITSKDDGEFELAFEYHAAKIVIKKLSSGTIHSATERAILMDQVKALESHIKFTGDHINALGSNEIPVKPVGMSNRTLTKILGTMVLLLANNDTPDSIKLNLNEYRKLIEEKYDSCGIDMPSTWDEFSTHASDAIELCKTDSISENFAPINALHSYIFILMQIISDQRGGKFKYGKRINIRSIGDLVKEQIQLYITKEIFQSVENLSRLNQTLGEIRENFTD